MFLTSPFIDQAITQVTPNDTPSSVTCAIATLRQPSCPQAIQFSFCRHLTVVGI